MMAASGRPSRSMSMQVGRPAPGSSGSGRNPNPCQSSAVVATISGLCRVEYATASARARCQAHARGGRACRRPRWTRGRRAGTGRRARSARRDRPSRGAAWGVEERPLERAPEREGQVGDAVAGDVAHRRVDESPHPRDRCPGETLAKVVGRGRRHGRSAPRLRREPPPGAIEGDRVLARSGNRPRGHPRSSSSAGLQVADPVGDDARRSAQDLHHGHVTVGGGGQVDRHPDAGLGRRRHRPVRRLDRRHEGPDGPLRVPRPHHDGDRGRIGEMQRRGERIVIDGHGRTDDRDEQPLEGSRQEQQVAIGRRGRRRDRQPGPCAPSATAQHQRCKNRPRVRCMRPTVVTGGAVVAPGDRGALSAPRPPWTAEPAWTARPAGPRRPS